MKRSILVLLLACSPSSPTTPAPSSHTATACDDACFRLRALTCPEGDRMPGGATCEDVCTAAESYGLALDPACVAGATSREAVRACGSVRCSP